MAATKRKRKGKVPKGWPYSAESWHRTKSGEIFSYVPVAVTARQLSEARRAQPAAAKPRGARGR